MSTISIWLPFYNDEKFIGQAIDACLRQTFTDFELILFNHASTDSSPQIVKSYSDPRIKYFETDKNLGAGSGLNFSKCFSYMTGKYIKLLCADDIMYDNCLYDLYTYMESNPEKDMCFADMQYIDENGNDLGISWSQERVGVDFTNDEKKTLKLFFKGISHLAYPTSFLKRKVLESIYINRVYIMLLDVSLWTDALIHGFKIGFLQKKIVYYRCHQSQLSSINNISIAARRGAFEYLSLCSIYFNIKNIDIVKFIVDSDYAKMLCDEDIDLIPFVIAHYYYTAYLHPADFPSGCEMFKLCGFMKIEKMLNDDLLAEKIYKKFGYGILEFRNFYSYPEIIQKKEAKIYKNTFSKYKYVAKNTYGKELSLFQILFLFFRKLIKICSLSYIRHGINHKNDDQINKYTV